MNMSRGSQWPPSTAPERSPKIDLSAVLPRPGSSGPVVGHAARPSLVVHHVPDGGTGNLGKLQVVEVETKFDWPRPTRANRRLDALKPLTWLAGTRFHLTGQTARHARPGWRGRKKTMTGRRTPGARQDDWVTGPVWSTALPYRV